MHIRELAKSDFAAWAPLWQGYLTFYESEVPDETTKLSFDRLTAGTDQMGAFVVEGDDGELIGIVHWLRHPSTWVPNDYCYLQDLFVAPHVRGGGVGRALIEAVYARAADLGCNRVYWLTQETNETAMKLYDRVAEKSGFLQYRKIF